MTLSRPLPVSVCLITYEFTYSPFSGNGILARSLVKSLLSLDCHVHVWCCRPAKQGDDHPILATEVTEEQLDRLHLYPTTLSPGAGWRRLDAESGWTEFVLHNLDPCVRRPWLNAVAEAGIVSIIDWTGASAYRSLDIDRNKTVVYLNFRVYSSGLTNGKATLREWYDEQEKAALSLADVVVALSEKDRASLSALVEEQGSPPEVVILLPPLRGDMEELAMTPTDKLEERLPANVRDRLKSMSKARCLVTCVVRLSPEKDVIRFVTLCKRLRGDLLELGYVPLLAGASSDQTYSQQVKDTLLEVFPEAILVESFLAPKALAAILAHAVLNVHPCAYDAYGMTAIEAAAMGAPSVIARDHVGATAILGPDASIPVVMQGADDFADASIESVRCLLRDILKLEELGGKAKQYALAWDEAAYGADLLGQMHRVLEKQQSL